MGSFSGVLQLPLVAAATIVVAFVSSDKLSFHTSLDKSDFVTPLHLQFLTTTTTTKAIIGFSYLGFQACQVPVPNINFLVPDSGLGRNFVPKLFYSSSYVEGGQKIVLILVEENFVACKGFFGRRGEEVP